MKEKAMDTQSKKIGTNPPRAYHKPILHRYGGLGEATKGVAAYSATEAVYQAPEQMS